MKKTFWISICAAILIVGCDSKPTSSESTATGSGQETSGTATTGSTTKTPTPSLDQVPANLKHDAFEYYGLGNSKKMSVQLTGTGISQTGEVSVELDKVEGQTATFKVVRSGAVGDSLGSDFVTVDAKGVNAVGNSMGKLSPGSYVALPADLTPGKTWNVKNKIERENGQQVEEDSVYKIEGLQDFKTKSGSQKALVVTSSGTATVTNAGDVKKMKSTTKSWYIKGLGLAKTEITFTEPGQPTNTITVEVTH